MTGHRRAGLRLAGEADPRFAAHRPDRGVDLLPAVDAFDRAHLVALTEAGWLDGADAAALLRALDPDTDPADADDRPVSDRPVSAVVAARRTAGGGIHSGEHLLTARLGEDPGGRIGLARSSADLGAVALRTIERDGLLGLSAALVDLRSALVDLAGRHLDTVMPMWAQGQPAQPTTLAHVLAAWAAALERDGERLAGALDRVSRGPAGAAIGTGSPFVTDRDRTAGLLGFAGPLDNTLDAVTAHDHVGDTLAAVALLGANLSRLADDLTLWSSAEVAIARFPDRYCGTSSVLAQARNAYVPQYVRGTGATAAGALVSALVVDRAATGAAVLDRHAVSEQVMAVLNQSVRNVRWLTEVVPALEWDTDRMADLTRRQWVGATDLAGALVERHGLPWRTAHQIVGAVVRLSEERGTGPADVSPALIVEAATVVEDVTGRGHGPVTLPPDEIAAALDPHRAVARRTGRGGPAPAAVRAQLDNRRARLRDDKTVVAVHTDRISRARADLDRAVQDLTQPSRTAERNPR